MKNPSAIYTVQYGKAEGRKQHGADGLVDFTFCGKQITDGWWITSVDHEGEVTCADCLRKMNAEAAPADGPVTLPARGR